MVRALTGRRFVQAIYRRLQRYYSCTRFRWMFMPWVLRNWKHYYDWSCAKTNFVPSINRTVRSTVTPFTRFVHYSDMLFWKKSYSFWLRDLHESVYNFFPKLLGTRHGSCVGVRKSTSSMKNHALCPFFVDKPSDYYVVGRSQPVPLELSVK